jgi:hypothetical protein
VSCDEQSNELEISIGCRSANRVDRGESVDGPVEPLAVLEQAQIRAYDFFKIPDIYYVALPKRKRKKRKTKLR